MQWIVKMFSDSIVWGHAFTTSDISEAALIGLFTTDVVAKKNKSVVRCAILTLAEPRLVASYVANLVAYTPYSNGKIPPNLYDDKTDVQHDKQAEKLESCCRLTLEWAH